MKLLNQIIPFAYAQDDAIGEFQAPPGIITEVGGIGSFLSSVIRFIIVLAGIWFIIQVILGGFSYITGAGDQKRTADATKKITDSIIGLIIIAAAFIIAEIVSQLIFGGAFNIFAPQLEQPIK